MAYTIRGKTPGYKIGSHSQHFKNVHPSPLQKMPIIPAIRHNSAGPIKPYVAVPSQTCISAALNSVRRSSLPLADTPLFEPAERIWILDFAGVSVFSQATELPGHPCCWTSAARKAS